MPRLLDTRTLTTVKTYQKALLRRTTALFFTMTLIAGMLTPTASALAAQQTPPPKITNPHIKTYDQQTLGQQIKQQYPGPAPATVSAQPAAADATSGIHGEFLQTKQQPQPAPQALHEIAKTPHSTPRELTEQRTATSTLSINKDGSLTQKQYFAPKFFKKEGKWTDINTTLTEDKNAGDAGTVFGRAFGAVQSWMSSTTNFIATDNEWQARFSPSDAERGMVRIKQGNEQVGFVPVGAKKVAPVVTTTKDGRQVVHYYDLWPGVNVEYIVESGAVKENIILKHKDATNRVSFAVIGATLQKTELGGHLAPSLVLDGVFNNEFAIAPPNLILNEFGLVTEAGALSQTHTASTVTVGVEKEYLHGLPDKAFPAVLDPTTFNSRFGTRTGGSYLSLKSDGYVCYSNICNPYAGSLYDPGGTLRYWRGALYAPYDQFRTPGNNLINATLHLVQRSNESFWTGDWGTHTYAAGHATCLNNFNCLEGGAFNASGVVTGSGSINVTSIYQEMINRGDFGAWLMIGGEDGTSHSFKNFDPGTDTTLASYVSFTYGGPPTPPSIATPTSGQIYVDPQPSFKVNTVDNPNGSTPLKYELLVSGGPSATGVTIASGLLDSLQWTMPDGMLKDGTTYYVQARSFDPITSTYSGWSTSVPFRIDMRTGKDKTQTYDTLGPVSVNLATGNVATNAASHTSTAVGGSLGVSLGYNSPLKSRSGLVGEYWNNQTHNGDPVVTRIDQAIDFEWQNGSPQTGTIAADGFSARWKGWFVAPKTGSYQFGARGDDGTRISIDGTVVMQNWTPGAHSLIYGSAVSLQEGQAVPITVEYFEQVLGAYMQVYAKGAVNEQIVPSEWLQTGVRPIENQYGLTGSYFGKFDGTNTFSSGNSLIMTRNDPYLNFDWGTGSPMPNGPDGFLVRWTGYVTVPTTGNYTFGVRSDDGVKIMLGNANTVVYNEWVDRGATESYGSAYTLTANTPTPITIEYYDNTGPASFVLKVQGAVPQQVVPLAWLSPRANVLPSGWNMGIDPDGAVTYDHITVHSTSAVLTDASGATHEYAWANGGYKPPVNEDGQLVRNADGTHTLLDADGRTYLFGADGTLQKLTSPADDRNPAALTYEYEGTPSRIKQITDGVNSTRWAKVHYYGSAECGSIPSGYDNASLLSGMLCAVKTNDGRATYFYYVDKQLSRIMAPGNEIVDYGYEAVQNGGVTIGYRLSWIRDALANDAIAAGVRANDASTKTELGYDTLGRATSITQPAGSTGGTRIEHTVEYLPGVKPYVDATGATIAGYAGLTKQHVTGLVQPHGFTQRIQYDSLYRVTQHTDIANLTTVTEWDPDKDLIKSATGPDGLKTTAIYNDEDRPIESYGPAPAAWFGADRKPLPAYATQVPRADTKYDEGIIDPGVAWYNFKGNGFSGAPKLHTTGLNDPNHHFYANLASAPITADAGMDGIGFSVTGKLRVTQTAVYNITAYHDDAARLWVDDALLFDRWSRRTDTVGGVGANIPLEAGKVYRFRFDYASINTHSPMSLHLSGGNKTGYTQDWSGYLSSGYNLVTSTKMYDSTIGDSTTTTTYGLNPELGLPHTGTAGGGSLSLTTANTYETPGATGSLLRKTKKVLPGNTETNPSFAYEHYAAADTRDNPCTTSVTEAYKQAGFPKLKTEADPDGAGAQTSRKIETIYDDAGRVVASRYNTETWTCITYDTRGRQTQVAIPGYGSEAARTVTAYYSVGSNPLVTASSDTGGTVTTTIDLLGRTLSYTEVYGDTTTYNYDTFGRLVSKASPMGTESFVYDNYNRITEQRFDGVTYARITYDQYGHTSHVEYPDAGNQKLTLSRDALGRLTSRTYTQGDVSAPGANILPNSSTEQPTSGGGAPQDWVLNKWGTNTATFSYLNEGYNGSRSVKTEITAYTNGDAKWSFNPVTVTGSTSYTFKQYYRSNISTQLEVQYTHANNSVTYVTLGNPAASSNWAQTSYTFTTPSTAVKVGVRQLVKNVGWLNIDDATLSLTSQAAGTPTVLAGDTVTRSQSGRITSESVTAGTTTLNSNYTYDAVGRLTGATIGANTYSYGFGTQDASCGAGNNLNPNSGKNSNRTSQVINGVATTFCYDHADRLVSSSNALYSNPVYDSRGNMTSIGTGTTPLNFCYDSSNRNTCFTQFDSSGNGHAYFSGRDPLDRITYRQRDTISNWTWTPTSQWFNFYTGAGDGVAYVRDANWVITEKHLSLPGGVTLTLKPQEAQANNKKQYNLPNVHGDGMLTTNAIGANTSTGTGPANSYTYDPFGNPITANLPSNTAVGGAYAWAGNHGKLTETSFALTPITMGARVYLPGLGRFTQPDPIEGGTANNYVYVLDPVNGNDYSGMFCLQACGTITSFLQPAALINRFQPTAPGSRIQPTSQGSRVQGPGAARGIVRLGPTTPAPPAAQAPLPPAVISQIGSGISKSVTAAGNGVVAGVSWFGGGIKSGAQKVWDNPQVRGASAGCVLGVSSNVAWGIGTFVAGGPFVGLSGLAGGCALGGLGGYYDSVLKGSGQGFRDLDTTSGVYDMFRHLNYR